MSDVGPVLCSVLDSCESTQDLLKDAAKDGAPHGTWIASLEQTKGRGRQGREWSTTRGNLALSYLIKGVSDARQSWVGMLTGVLVLEAIEKLAPALAQNVKLKWPNDLWRTDLDPYAKVGGILGESTGDAIVMGIGINTVIAPKGLELPAATLECDTAVLRERICEELSAIPLILNRMSIEDLRTQFWRLSLFQPGDKIQWSSGRGTIEGLGDFGELRVALRDGSVQNLFAEDVKALRPSTL